MNKNNNNINEWDKVISSPIRWAGSKISLLNELLSTFEKRKQNYIEPFLGSGSVLINVLNNNNQLGYENFYVNDSNENIFMNDSKFDYSIINKTVTDFKSEMLIFIIGTLLDFSKELKTSNKGFPFYAYNLLNCLIVLNEELNIKPDILFNNNILCEAIYTLISLISDGFLYSNFCIEFKDKRGKIISEIILDIFLSIPSEFFKQNMFLSTFIKNKEKMTIFCVMDNYK